MDERLNSDVQLTFGHLCEVPMQLFKFVEGIMIKQKPLRIFREKYKYFYNNPQQ